MSGEGPDARGSRILRGTFTNNRCTNGAGSVHSWGGALSLQAATKPFNFQVGGGGCGGCWPAWGQGWGWGWGWGAVQAPGRVGAGAAGGTLIGRGGGRPGAPRTCADATSQAWATRVGDMG